MALQVLQNSNTLSILDEVVGNVLHITITRPESKNALNNDAYVTMTRAIREANNNDQVKCIVIRGSDGVFTTGHDPECLEDTAEKNRLDQIGRQFLQVLVDNKKPMIACIDGAAVGIGTTMLFHCDYVVATKRSHFHTPFVDLHITPEAASSLLGPRQLGYRRAFRLLCLGERWKAAKAFDYDLIDYVADTEEEAERNALSMAKRLATKPLQSLVCSRQLLRSNIGDMEGAMMTEIIRFEQCISSSDAQSKYVLVD